MDATDSAWRTRRSRLQALRRIPLSVHGAALLFAAVLVGFVLLYPTFYGFDEPQHVDRIYATTDGELLPDPGKLLAAEGVARAQDTYVETWPYLAGHSYADDEEVPRGERPSLLDLGGHTKATPGGYSNQLSEHPPAYYWLLGGVMWLVPNDARLPADLYVGVLRGLDVVLVLPLPYLVWWGVRKLTGEGPIAQAAAFVPVLVPGLARVGASVNNDNLLILTTTAILGFLAGVTKGDRSLRTAIWVGALMALSLLTKGNALVLPVVVATAYLAGWIRTRGRPPWRAWLVVTLGAAMGGLWWVGNLVRFGAVRPVGWGDRLATALGPPRPPGDPASATVFADYIQQHLPDRFWGGLGLIDAPQLPGWSVAALGWLLVVGFVVSLAFARGNRGGLVVLISGFAITIVLTITTSWSHFEHYLTIPGVQGRYLYPFVLGVAASIALGLGVLLGRFRWAAPPVLLVAALGAEYLAADAVMAHIWLPDGQLPRPGNIDDALANVIRFAPFPPFVTAALLGLVVLAILCAILLTWLGLRRERRAAPPGSPSQAINRTDQEPTAAASAVAASPAAVASPASAADRRASS